MAYDPVTHRDDALPCAEHRWPKNQPGGCLRSCWRLEYQHCNNCPAMKLTWTIDVLVAGEWRTVTDEKVVEPTINIHTEHFDELRDLIEAAVDDRDMHSVLTTAAEEKTLTAPERAELQAVAATRCLQLGISAVKVAANLR